MLFKWLGLSIVQFWCHSQLCWCSHPLNLFLTVNWRILAVNPRLYCLLRLPVSIEYLGFFSAGPSVDVLVSKAELARCEHEVLLSIRSTSCAWSFRHISDSTATIHLHLRLFLVWSWCVVAVSDCVEVLGICCTLNLNILRSWWRLLDCLKLGRLQNCLLLIVWESVDSVYVSIFKVLGFNWHIWIFGSFEDAALLVLLGARNRIVTGP